MSVYLAPLSKSFISKELRKHRGLSALRFLLALILVGSGCGYFLWAKTAEEQQYCLYAIGASVLLIFLLQGMLRRLATKGGLAFLAQTYDDPLQRSLATILDQLFETNILLRPVLRVGQESHVFELVAVSPQGVTFFRTARSEGHPEMAAVRSACQRLSEQYSVPLLGRVRFIQLINSTGETKLGQDWQVCLLRDLSRLFPKTEPAQATVEIAKAFRAIYNMALPANQSPIPIQGQVLAAGKAQKGKSKTSSGAGKKGFEILVKVIIYSLLAVALAVCGIFYLQYKNYEMAEPIMKPARATLRKILPPEWQQRLVLGMETVVDEKDTYATVAIQNALISMQVGQLTEGAPVVLGQELTLAQVEKDSAGNIYYYVNTEQINGWLPATALKFRHLVRAGTPLYERPYLTAKQLGTAPNDSPVALLEVWERQNAAGETEIWSKVLFMDRRVLYINERL